MRRRELALFEHISIYVHCLVFLEEDDKEIEFKIKLWNKFFNSKGKSKFKYYKKLLAFKRKENQIIMKALNKIEEMKSENSAKESSIFPKGVVAIKTYIHEEAD